MNSHAGLKDRCSLMDDICTMTYFTAVFIRWRNGANRILKTIACSAVFTLSASIHAQGPDGENTPLRTSMGLGLISAPSYLGSENNLLSVFPNISVKYGHRFTASLRGIEYTLLTTESLQAGPTLAYDFGREERSDEGPFVISGKSSSELVGLGDVEGTIKLGFFLEYSVGSFVAKFQLHQGIDGGYEGLAGEASTNYRTPVQRFNRPLFLSVGPAVTFGGKEYNSAFFDVSETQSAASGIDEFDADGGVNSVGVHISAVMPLSKKKSLVGLLNYDQLTGDVERSTIVSQRGSKNQTTAGLFFNYQY